MGPLLLLLMVQTGRVPFEQFTLPNGLRVIYSEDRSTPIVTVNFWYEVGSRNERPGGVAFCGAMTVAFISSSR